MKYFIIITMVFFAPLSCKKTQTEEKPEEQVQDTKEQKVDSVAKEKDKSKKELAKVDSPIQIPICEKYIQFVCKCSRKYPDKKFVKEACEMARKTYPSWKDMAKDPEQQQAIMRSCKKAINELRISEQCK